MKRLAGVFSLLLAGTAGAEVLVTVRIESPPMMARYRPRTANVEQAIASEVARILPRHLRFRYWSYAPAGPQAVGDYALNFRIYKERNEQRFAVTLQAKDKSGGTWDEVWMHAGDLAAQGFPDLTVAGPRIAGAIERTLLQQHQSEIGARMKAIVPVATAAQWQRGLGKRDEHRLVLPLRWPGSQGLVNSVFRVKCTWPGRGPAELQTRALDQPAFYDDQRTGLRYQALTLKPLMRIFDHQQNPVTKKLSREVRALQPIVVYLEDDDPLGLHMAGGQQ